MYFRESEKYSDWNVSKSGSPCTYKWRDPFLIGSLGSLWRYKRFLSCLCCSGQPSTKCFFLTAHYLFVPLAQRPRQAVVQGRLSPNMCLRSLDTHKRTNIYIQAQELVFQCRVTPPPMKPNHRLNRRRPLSGTLLIYDDDCPKKSLKFTIFYFSSSTFI